MKTIAIVLLAAVSCATYDDQPPASAQSVLSKFQTLSGALDEGYVVDTRSDYFVPGVGMAFENASLVKLDPQKPQGLLYEFGNLHCDDLECPNEGFKLVGMKYSVAADQAGVAPRVFDQPLGGPTGTPPRYELVVWLKENPNGRYAATNPTVQPPSWWPGIYATWKARSERYPTPDAAAADGYELLQSETNSGQTVGCVINDVLGENGSLAVGGMGYHWWKTSIISNDPTTLHPDAPEGLIYGQHADGSWTLTGIEWWLWSERQPTPTMFDVRFDGPMPGHFRGMPEHFDLHSWVGYPNPDGLFSKWNRAITCPTIK